MALPTTGDIAPDFALPADDGTTFRLSDHRQRPVVLYFYPKDDTSGCTKEAQDFTAQMAMFDNLGAIVVGVSPDPVKSHAKFRAKHKLKVMLVSDEEKTVLQAYGVWVEKSMYGRKYMGVERSTFLIGTGGRIARAWRKVSVPGHVDEVLEELRKN